MPASDALLEDAFHRTLRQVCFAEKLSARTHGRAARRAGSEELRQIMRAQRDGSASRVSRLNLVFGMIGKSARSETCTPIRDMTMEFEEYLNESCPRAAADAVLICWAQEIDAYCIGRYGTLKDWSSKLGLAAAEDAIDESLLDVSRGAADLARVAETMALCDGTHAAAHMAEARTEFADRGFS